MAQSLRMNTQTNLYKTVMACLASRAITQKQTAAESGVPFSTVTKIAQGTVSDPSVHTIQKLHDYFVSKGLATRSQSQESA